MLIPAPQELSSEELQVISLDNICTVDGSWTSTAQFSGCEWFWKDSFGKIQLIGTRNLRRRETALHSEVKTLRWAMESMLQHSSCQRFNILQGFDRDVEGAQTWSSFATEHEVIKTLQICFQTSRYLISQG